MNVGTTIGNVVVLMCCLIGLIVFAVRANGWVRVTGILGFTLLMIDRIVALVWSAAQSPALNPGGDFLAVVVSLLSAFFGFAGVVCLALSFVLKPRRESTHSVPLQSGPGFRPGPGSRPRPGSSSGVGPPPDSGRPPGFSSQTGVGS